MDQPGAAPAAGVILDAAGNLYGTTAGGAAARRLGRCLRSRRRGGA